MRFFMKNKSSKPTPSPDLEYFFMVSGGKDSTAMVLKALDEGIKGTLVYGDTRLNMASSRETMQKLASYTGWPLQIVRYEGEKPPIEILKESFYKIPKALAYIKEHDVFRRNMFQCCNILKHKPMIEYAKEQPSNSCFALGLKGSDYAIHRKYRLRELREQNTFFRRHKANNLLYYYPLRDWTEEQVMAKLREHGFQNTHSSGCTICPIFCLFEHWRKKDPDTWRRSVQMADRLGIEHPAAGQQFLTKLCTGDVLE